MRKPIVAIVPAACAVTAGLGYAPLPPEVVNLEMQALNRIKL